MASTGSSMPTRWPTSRAHRPAQLTTCSACTVPLSVTSSQEPSDFGFKKKRVLLAVAREPVIFNDPNGYRPRVIVVILARTIQGYLLTISRAVKLFGNPALIGRIARSGSSEEVIAAIRDAEERLMASVSR